MTTISLPLNITKALASMVAFTAKDIDKLDRVYVEILPNSVSAVASDRYAIIESLYTERNGDGSLEFQITAEIAKFIGAIKTKDTKASVEITLDGANLTISTLGQSATFAGSQKANGAELFAKLSEHATGAEAKAEIAQPITLNVALLSRVAKLLDYDGKKVDRWEFHLGQTGSDSRKPNPINAYSAGVITWHLVQQPLLSAK